MTRKVHILTTGGTISQHSTGRGPADFGFDPAQLASNVGIADVSLEFRSVVQKGSKDVGPDDWRLIATAVADAAAAHPAGVVILHGTDTMHYTAAALSFMLGGLGFPVVLTGSMIPGGDPGSDSLPNLRDAVRVAAYAELAEVCIVFSADVDRSHSLIIRGNRARKIHSHAINAFASINMPPLGTCVADALSLDHPGVRRRQKGKLWVRTELEPNLALIKLVPVTTATMLARQLENVGAAVLEGTGIGHVRTELLPVIKEFAKPVVMSTQTLYGGECLGMYAADRLLLEIPNVIPGGDMSSDTALVKLMWALPQGDVRRIMQTDVAGEMTPRIPRQ